MDKVLGLIEIELAMYPTWIEISSLKSSKADNIQGRKNMLLGTRTAGTGCTSALSRMIAVKPRRILSCAFFMPGSLLCCSLKETPNCLSTSQFGSASPSKSYLNPHSSSHCPCSLPSRCFALRSQHLQPAVFQKRPHPTSCPPSLQRPKN